jgi:hypothetical protein
MAPLGAAKRLREGGGMLGASVWRGWGEGMALGREIRNLERLAPPSVWRG